jgi:hypothetical protein
MEIEALPTDSAAPLAATQWRIAKPTPGSKSIEAEEIWRATAVALESAIAQPEELVTGRVLVIAPAELVTGRVAARALVIGPPELAIVAQERATVLRQVAETGRVVAIGWVTAACLAAAEDRGIRARSEAVPAVARAAAVHAVHRVCAVREAAAAEEEVVEEAGAGSNLLA